MQNNVSHTGICIAISGNTAKVRIDQLSACAGCKAAALCSSAEKKEKIIDARIDGKNISIGDQVTLSGSSSSKAHAVTLAYIAPLILVTAALTISIAYGVAEPVAALISITTLVPYYLIIWILGGKLKQTFEFKVN